VRTAAVFPAPISNAGKRWACFASWIAAPALAPAGTNSNWQLTWLAEAREKIFAGAAEVGKCDARRARRLHAYGARTAGGDQEEGPDRPAQQAKGDKHCLSHAVDRQCRYGVAGGCNEDRPARPEFR